MVFERQLWRKRGLIFCPDGLHATMRSHASVPFAEPIGGGLFRVYFSSRDERQRSRTFSLVLDIRVPDRIVEVRGDPILDLGELGGFDDSGAMLTWIAPITADASLAYYVGWNLRVTVPFQNALGVARMTRDGVVERFRGPTMDRTLDEPHFVASACILRDGGRFRCWYLSCVGWEVTPAGPRHRYHIKYAESADGLHWNRDGRVAIDFAQPAAGRSGTALPRLTRTSSRMKIRCSCSTTATTTDVPASAWRNCSRTSPARRGNPFPGDEG
jgi:hypothetical protein